MGQTFSYKLKEKDVKLVQSVNCETLKNAIASLLNKGELSHTNNEFDSEKMANETLMFLEKTLKEEYIDQKISPNRERVVANSEVLIWFEQIGQVSIRSGQSSHRMAVLVNQTGYAIVLFEQNYIKTPKITGKLLNLLSHFYCSQSDTPLNDIKPFQYKFSNARNFVQYNSKFDWTDASINFKGACQLILISGNGLHKYDIDEILAKQNIQPKENLKDVQRDLLEQKVQLSKLGAKIRKKIEALETQLQMATNQSVNECVKGKQSTEAELFPKQYLRNIKRKKVEEEKTSNEQQQIKTEVRNNSLIENFLQVSAKMVEHPTLSYKKMTETLDDMKKVRGEKLDEIEDLHIPKQSEIYENQLEASPSNFNLKEINRDTSYENELRHITDNWGLRLRIIGDEEKLNMQRQKEIIKMIDTENKLQEELEKGQSYLMNIERNLKGIQERLSKVKQFNRTRMNELSKEMMKTKRQMKDIGNEQNITEQLERTVQHGAIYRKHVIKPIMEKIILEKFDSREIGKLRIKFCGTEGAEKTDLQINLENILIRLMGYYKTKENETFWQNCTIEIFNENICYHVQIGNGKRSIIITSTNGDININDNCQHENCAHQ